MTCCPELYIIEPYNWLCMTYDQYILKSWLVICMRFDFNASITVRVAWKYIILKYVDSDHCQPSAAGSAWDTGQTNVYLAMHPCTLQLVLFAKRYYLGWLKTCLLMSDKLYIITYAAGELTIGSGLDIPLFNGDASMPSPSCTEK